MKIYIATRGEYSDYRVCHAFARREDAESYQVGEDVLEMDLHDGPVEVRYWYDLDWRADLPARREIKGLGRVPNPYTSSELRDFDGDGRHVEHTWTGRYLNVQGWDRQLVRKVYSEQRAQYVARQEGIS
ncbi:MAG: hypothetical protein ACRDP5_15870 [Streptosporangiaceae bacterium]